MTAINLLTGSYINTGRGNKPPTIEWRNTNAFKIHSPPETECLHTKCSDCNGSGHKHWGGICVHMISCPCSSCSPRAV